MLGDIEPVTTMPTRNDTQAVSPTVKHANRWSFLPHYKLQERRLIERLDAQRARFLELAPSVGPDHEIVWFSC